MTITLDGVETVVNLDVGLDLAKSGKKLLYAEVTHPGKATYYTTDTSFSVEDGTVINTRYCELVSVKNACEVRTNAPYGLRYLTALNKVDYAALKTDTKVSRIELGTVILPANTISDGILTSEALENVTHLDIPAKDGAWFNYNVSYCHTFAGSIVDIKETNFNKSFLVFGSIKSKLLTYTLYIVSRAKLLIASTHSNVRRLGKNSLNKL